MARVNKKSESGFAVVSFVATLPLLLLLITFLLFNHFLIRNWSESLHICRTELLSTQKQAIVPLKSLLLLNHPIKILRIKKIQAQASLALALAAQNPAAVAQLEQEILEITRQQNIIFNQQQNLIYTANTILSTGPQIAAAKLFRQNSFVQMRLPQFFDFSIKNISAQSSQVAVQSDGSERPSLYKLHPQFTKKQTVSLNWISTFSTQKMRSVLWIPNSHFKKDSCSASLLPEGDNSESFSKEPHNHSDFQSIGFSPQFTPVLIQ